MAKSGEKSQLGFKHNLELFKLPKTNAGITSSTWLTYSPLNSFKDSYDPVVFNVHSATEYLEPSSCFVYVEISVKKADGTNLATGTELAVTHNLGQAFFSVANVLLNGSPYSRPNPFAPYIGHFQDLLFENKPVENQKLKLQIFSPDKDAETFTNSNPGWVERSKLCKDSKKISFICRINDPLFYRNDRLLPPDSNLSISLSRSNLEFILEGKDTRSTATDTFPYQVKLEACRLHIQKYGLNPQIAKSHTSMLSSGKRINIPLHVNNLKVIAIPKELLHFQSDVIHQGIVPRYVLVTFIDNDALLGSIKKNTFSFKHFGISQVICQLDGDYPITKQIDLDIAGGNYLLAYKQTASLVEKLGGKYTIDDFKGPNFFLAFELSPDFDPNLLQIPRQGQLQFHLKFKTANDKSITMLLFTEMDHLLQINKQQELISDFMLT